MGGHGMLSWVRQHRRNRRWCCRWFHWGIGARHYHCQVCEKAESQCVEATYVCDCGNGCDSTPSNCSRSCSRVCTSGGSPTLVFAWTCTCSDRGGVKLSYCGDGFIVFCAVVLFFCSS